MSDQDQSEKTEEPTPKKLSEARNKGQIATSKEVNSFAVLLGATLVIGIFGPFVALRVYSPLAGIVEKAGTMPIDQGSSGDILFDLFTSVLIALSPVFAVFMVLALAASLGQSGILFTAEPITPKFDKISPIKGFSRLFSLRSIVEFLKGIAKMGVVGTVALILVLPELDRLETIVQMDVRQLLEEIQTLVMRLLFGVAAVMVVIAVADYIYQKYEHIKQLKMSRQEIRDEHKQSEGDPHVKARLRQIRHERARQRMMAAVPQADVVVTNPTHFAVALKYDTAVMAAPTVVAKGVDNVAFRIREVAEANGVPIVENPPLARALFGGVDLDQQIPEEHYQAVAQIISYVYRLKGKRMSA
ncbi:flagellar biosynthesis protein FlhB [Thalassobaculum sp.]|uniref:flagellar biosynthesis protein FlhB n=1 Tax=Thalassobaculum sp. TaxID=2022740 RepID=UPI003B5A0777